MAPKVCYIQDTCPYYEVNTNDKPTHHTRITAPCRKYLADKCDMIVQIRAFYGETLACNIAKIKSSKVGTHPPAGV